MTWISNKTKIDRLKYVTLLLTFTSIYIYKYIYILDPGSIHLHNTYAHIINDFIIRNKNSNNNDWYLDGGYRVKSNKIRLPWDQLDVVANLQFYVKGDYN